LESVTNGREHARVIGVADGAQEVRMVGDELDRAGELSEGVFEAGGKATAPQPARAAGPRPTEEPSV